MSLPWSWTSKGRSGGDKADEMTPEPHDGISNTRGNVRPARRVFPVFWARRVPFCDSWRYRRGRWFGWSGRGGDHGISAGVCGRSGMTPSCHHLGPWTTASDREHVGEPVVTGSTSSLGTGRLRCPPGCGPSGSCNPMEVRVLSPTPVPHGLDLKARPPLNR